MLLTSEKCDDSPVILFVHGGSWRWGTKRLSPDLIGKQFARDGILFVTINYSFIQRFNSLLS